MGRHEVEALFERARLARETACLLRSRIAEARLERDDARRFLALAGAHRSDRDASTDPRGFAAAHAR
jgi:hypothetical protein